MGLFNGWFEHILCPALKPGQIVILDNASFHKSSDLFDMVQACRLLVKDFAHPCAKSTRFKRQPFLPRPPSSPALTHLKNKRDAQALKWLYAAERFLSAITLATERGR